MDKTDVGLQTLRESIARRALYGTLLLASAVSIVCLLRVLPAFDTGAMSPITYDDCLADSDSDSDSATVTPGSYLFHVRVMDTFWGSFESINCKQDINLTIDVVTELMGKQFLDCGAKSLCIGDASPMAVPAMQRLGFSSVIGLNKPRPYSLKQKKIVYELNYHDHSFDFVFSKDLDTIPVPDPLVLEVERVLKPGGIGALLVGADASNPNDVMRSVAPVSSSLRSSSIVHVKCINEFNLIVFKKRSETSVFYQNALPPDCPSLTFTKPFIKLMEPLEEERPLDYAKGMSYLPKFVDISGRKRLVYIDIGVGELLNKTNISDWFIPSYPIDQKAFSVYFVHYNTSILLSHVKRPGIAFVYHPGLDGKLTTAEIYSGNDLDPFVGDEEFDILAWFKETVKNADFVVLKMNAGEVEMKLLSDIFESGAICFVNELFLGCPDVGDGQSVKTKESCMNIYKGLRSNGVYVHQWWGDENSW
ncbi:uncharacterized protein LOC114748829 [Neltuma alba]|uniref:uncharacterized protein LOC114732819 n=1 Tax=Neltuma alba TaxID=207710 RepID=UPI0010A52D1D|nr:uncharacterized protein LOC114732819 [Prosopis alba]XP_028776031.1 uncharacterized protein LOC114732833 [Prosopis alba]XP_028793117.1 uncharacterized protein LOC114748829 [Prosopis alba]